MTGREAVPLPGPLDRAPALRSVDAIAQLDVGLAEFLLGEHDQRVRAWAMTNDAETIATLASWLRRSWAVGVEAGRAERVDEQPVVAGLRALLAAEQERADRLHREAAELDHELRGERQAGQRCGQAVDEVVAATAVAESALQDPAADRRMVLEGLLAGIEQATTTFTRGRRGGAADGGDRP